MSQSLLILGGFSVALLLGTALGTSPLLQDETAPRTAVSKEIRGEWALAQRTHTSTFSIDLSPHNSENVQTAQKGSVFRHRTVPYFSQDLPRDVELYYASDHAYPTGDVLFDIASTTSTPPSLYSVRLKTLAGATLVQTNGREENFFVAGSGVRRLGAQFDAAHLPSGLHRVLLIVSAWKNGVKIEEASVHIRVAIQNEIQSPYGPGWSIAGLQRLVMSGDTVVIATGEGTTHVFVRKCSSCTAFVAPVGEFSQLVRDAATGRYVRSYPEGQRVFFSNLGYQDSVADPLGNTIRYVYSGDRLVSVRDPIGKSIHLEYAGDGRLHSVVDPGGRRTRIVRDGTGQTTQIVDTDGLAAHTLEYDGRRRVVVWSDRAAVRWTLLYSPVATLSTVTGPEIVASDVLTRPTWQTFSPHQQAIPGPEHGSPTVPFPAVEPSAIVWRSSDPVGNQTRVWVDRFGNPTQIEDPLGRHTVLRRNEASQITRAERPSGHALSYTWDGAQLIRVVDELLQDTASYEYGAFAQLVAEKRSGVSEVRHFLGVGGHRDSSVVIATGAKYRYQYSSTGQLSKLTDPGGHLEFREYDPIWSNINYIRTSSDTGRVSRYRYDGFGRQVAAVDPERNIDSVAYDLINRIRASYDPHGDSTIVVHGPVLVTEIRDALGQRHTFTHNGIGWVVADTDPRGRTTYYGYDATGRVIRRVNRRGQSISYSLDALGRILSTSGAGSVHDVTFSYDSQDRWIAAQNGFSTDTIFFDRAGRVAGEVAVGPGGRTATESFYNKRNLRTNLRIVQPVQRTITYRFNAASQLDRLTDYDGGNTVLTYDPDGGLASIDYPNLVMINRDFASTHQASRERIVVAGVERGGYGLTRDWSGRVAERWNRSADTATTYEYDNRGRLMYQYRRSFARTPLCPNPTESGVDVDYGMSIRPSGGEDCDGAGGMFDEVAYVYDANGNLQPGIYGPGDRLIRWNGDSLGYDDDGNLTFRATSGGVRRFAWNIFGQLTSVVIGSDTTTFAYDGFGRRVQKRSPLGTVNYRFDGANILLELDTSGMVMRAYTPYPGLDQPHSVYEGGTMKYFVRDHLGSITGIVNSTNQVTATWEYDSWGTVTNTTGQSQNRILYAGREWDPETDLYHMRARYYDPSLRRFISPDPAGLHSGTNPYLYAQNDPINGKDPSGLICYRVTLSRVVFKVVNGNRVVVEKRKVSEWIECEVEGPSLEGSGGGSTRLRFPCPTSLTGESLTKAECDQIADAVGFLFRHPYPTCGKMAGAHVERMRRGLVFFDKTLPYNGRQPRGTDLVLYGRPTFSPTGGGTSGTQLGNTIPHEEGHDMFGYGHGDRFRGKPSDQGDPTRLGDRCHSVPVQFPAPL